MRFARLLLLLWFFSLLKLLLLLLNKLLLLLDFSLSLHFLVIRDFNHFLLLQLIIGPHAPITFACAGFSCSWCTACLSRCCSPRGLGASGGHNSKVGLLRGLRWLLCNFKLRFLLV